MTDIRLHRVTETPDPRHETEAFGRVEPEPQRGRVNWTLLAVVAACVGFWACVVLGVRA